MKKALLIFLSVVMFSSCLSTDEDCPVDTRLHFELDDQYDINGTFDSSIGNDVLLYVFKDKVLTRIETISYSDIQSYGRAGVPFRKDEKTSGNLDFIAWSTPAATQADLPQWLEGRNHDDLVLELDAVTRAVEDCQPAACGVYMGRSSKTEEVYESTEHRFGMKHVACRVEVNVTDLRGEFTKAGAKPGVWVSGTMKEMNMLMAGCGSEARVYKDMCVVTRAAEQYTTERFGVLPSGSGQTLSVDIMNADEKLVTLTVPSDDLPRGAEAGGLVIFEYTLGATEFTVIVNGYRRNYVVIDGM